MKTKFLLAQIAALSIALCASAQAGQWVMEGYEYNMKSLTDEQGYGSTQNGQLHGIPGFFRTKTPQSNSGLRQPSGDGEGIRVSGSLGMRKTNQYGGLVSPPYRFFETTGYITLTVTPVFRWEPNRIDSSEHHTSTADPNDVAPDKLWYYESGEVSVTRGYYMPYGNERYVYNNDAPYLGHHFSVQEVDNGLGSEATESQLSYNGVGNRAFKSHVQVKDAKGASTVRGETRTLRVKVQTTSAALNSEVRDENYSASYSATYSVDLLRFDLMSRLKGDHDATDLTTDLIASDYRNIPSAYIAAGGFETEAHDHEADIVMAVKTRGGNWGNGTPIPDVERDILPRLRISNREGVEKSAKTQKQGGTTDSSGRILSDVLTSRDIESRMYARDMVSVHLGSAPANSNPIYMHWGNVKWRMGQEGDKQWNTRFLLLGSDYSEWVWVQIKKYDDKPLLGHTVRLIVDRLQVSETDEQTGEVETTLYTTNKTEADQYSDNGDDDPSFRVVYAKDLTGDVSRFIALPGAMSDSGGGVYKGQFTINQIKGVEINTLKLALEDQGVYRPEY